MPVFISFKYLFLYKENSYKENLNAGNVLKFKVEVLNSKYDNPKYFSTNINNKKN